MPTNPLTEDDITQACIDAAVDAARASLTGALRATAETYNTRAASFDRAIGLNLGRVDPPATYTYDEVEIAKRTAARAAATPTRYEARCGGRLVAYGPTVAHVAAIAAEITFHEVYTGPDGVTHRTEVIR